MSTGSKIHKFVKHGKNGELIPDSWDRDEIVKKYPYMLKIVKVSWQHNTDVIELDMGEDCESVAVLPDRSGVLGVGEGDQRCLLPKARTEPDLCG